MKQNYLTIGLIALIFIVTQSKQAGQSVAPVIRAQQIELVDKNGKTRASLKIEDDETTVFRLLDKTGTIRVKLGASKDGSGLVLLNDSTEVGIQALAQQKGAVLKLEHNGKKLKIEP